MVESTGYSPRGSGFASRLTTAVTPVPGCCGVSDHSEPQDFAMYIKSTIRQETQQATSWLEVAIHSEGKSGSWTETHRKQKGGTSGWKNLFVSEGVEETLFPR